MVTITYTASLNDNSPLPSYVHLDTANNTVLNFTFAAFTFTPANCSVLATITYTSTLANGTALPSYIAFDPTTRSF